MATISKTGRFPTTFKLGHLYIIKNLVMVFTYIFNNIEMKGVT